MLDLLLVITLGFLGSFGHCAGMCGPLTVAFSLAHRQESPNWRQQLYFHGLLNLGRVLSYALLGAGIGALSSVLVAGGQLAGIGSHVRQGIAIFTGVLLIWFGLSQVGPGLIPRIPLLRGLMQGKLHRCLSTAMSRLSLKPHWWTPALLGMVWGLVPCGFLYVAQIKAAEAGNLWLGGATMLAFGLGTMPVMLTLGVSASLVSADRRSQLFRMGGWLTIVIGVLTLLRTGEMVDFTGYGALFAIMLALIARPVSHLWPQLLHYRRGLGVGAFLLALTHTGYMLDHTFNWDFSALSFMLPAYQVGIWTGCLAVVLMIPAALTSFDWMVKSLGQYWRRIHLLVIPALVLSGVHVTLTSSDYLGNLELTGANKLRVILLGVSILGVLLVRWRFVWSLLFLDRFYAPPLKYKK